LNLKTAEGSTVNTVLQIKTLFFWVGTVLSLITGLAYAADLPVPTASPNEALSPAEPDQWSNHFQATTVTQAKGAITSPYGGPHSLSEGYENRTSMTATLFTGHRLWKDAYAFVNPEESGGSGLSGTQGIAGFPNGEIYRVSDPTPQINLSRAFIQQDFELGGESEKIEDDINQFQAVKSIDRFTFVFGKFSLNDYFDNNTYTHDPRTQFLNWSLMDNGAWDYAADTRGYDWGFYFELHLTAWSFRFALVQESAVANGLDLDSHLLKAHAENFEVEYRYMLKEHPGKARLLSYTNQADMGNYQNTLNLAAQTHTTPDITQTRSYCTKYGFGLNLEQEISSNIGVFSRLGWNNGATESWAFTEVDRTESLGASIKGALWNRADDLVGGAVIVNELSSVHASYLAAGGEGFLLGDGALNYAPEEIFEAYYLYKLSRPVGISPDFQFVKNPGYNADRGPAAIFALRFHYEI
jgi:high affinity Mn2+ porin